MLDALALATEPMPLAKMPPASAVIRPALAADARKPPPAAAAWALSLPLESPLPELPASLPPLLAVDAPPELGDSPAEAAELDEPPPEAAALDEPPLDALPPVELDELLDDEPDDSPPPSELAELPPESPPLPPPPPPRGQAGIRPVLTHKPFGY